MGHLEVLAKLKRGGWGGGGGWREVSEKFYSVARGVKNVSVISPSCIPSLSLFSGADAGGGGGGQDYPPPPTHSPFGGHPNFIKRGKTLRACKQKHHVLVINSYPVPPPPPFRNPVSAPASSYLISGPKQDQSVCW